MRGGLLTPVNNSGILAGSIHLLEHLMELGKTLYLGDLLVY